MRNTKYTTEEIQNYLDNRFDNNFKLLSPYENKRTKLHLKCLKHNIVFDRYLYSFKKESGSGCFKCLKEKDFRKRGYSTEYINQLIGPDYVLLDKYKGTRKYYNLKHITCGYVFKRRGSQIVKKVICPICGHPHKLTPQEYKYKFNLLRGDEFVLLSEYTKSNVKVKVKHKLCGDTWEVEASAFLNHLESGCPLCKPKSSSEEEIGQYLKSHQIPFIREYKFQDCKDVLPLPFDFYVANKVLIEYQGEQHYSNANYFTRTETSYKRYLRHDNIKYNYAKEHNIPLLIIPYTYQSKLTEYLDKHLLPLI